MIHSRLPRLPRLLLSCLLVVSCAPTDWLSRRGTHTPTSPLREKYEKYRTWYGETQLDSHGLVCLGGSCGDSALFSALARASHVPGAVPDPGLLLPGGKPVRHPEVTPGVSRTPASRDMFSGLLLLLQVLPQREALPHVEAVRRYLETHPAIVAGVQVGYLLCDRMDRIDYQISDENWWGRCLLTPPLMGDLLRLHVKLGGLCDTRCATQILLGAPLPATGTGFVRHLGALSLLRRSLDEGSLSPLGLAWLYPAVESQPRNALLQALLHAHTDGRQEAATEILMNPAYFPDDRLPDSREYCTHYLWERDYDSEKPRERDQQSSASSVSADWSPCPEENPGEPGGRGLDFLVAAAIILGELRAGEDVP